MYVTNNHERPMSTSLPDHDRRNMIASRWSRGGYVYREGSIGVSICSCNGARPGLLQIQAHTIVPDIDYPVIIAIEV